MTDYNALKVSELRDLVKERGLQLAGAKRKAEYVEALEAQDKENGGAGAENGDAAPAKDEDGEDEPMGDAQADAADDDSQADRKRKRDASEPMEDVDEATAKKTRTSEQGPPSSEPRSEHSATSALYVKNLSRPLQAQAFRSELAALTDGGEQSIVDLHLDALKTHAFVVCQDINTARHLRSSLHDRPWPQSDSQRKKLFVDYVPENSVQDWIEQETSAARDAKFEVAYSQDQFGNTVADLVELNARPNDSQYAQDRSRPSNDQYESRADEEPEQERPRAPANKLDELYSYTDAKPKIYYKPVKQELAQQRLEEIDRETARDWQNGKAWNRTTRLAPVDQLRRYTFDDGFKVVDGGVDFGGFGRRQGAGGTGGYNAAYPRGGGGAGNGARRYRP